jgi:amidophosphoribosyltransferase
MRKDNFVEGIENVFENITVSCSLLILTEKGISPQGTDSAESGGNGRMITDTRSQLKHVISEHSYEPNIFLGLVRSSILMMRLYQLRDPGEQLQICAFLWVYYGYPPSYYEV